MNFPSLLFPSASQKQELEEMISIPDAWTPKFATFFASVISAALRAPSGWKSCHTSFSITAKLAIKYKNSIESASSLICLIKDGTFCTRFVIFLTVVTSSYSTLCTRRYEKYCLYIHPLSPWTWATRAATTQLPAWSVTCNPNTFASAQG
jgi:hypothetical protein